MNHKFELERYRVASTQRFNWNDNTGIITGDAPIEILNAMLTAKRRGYVIVEPEATGIEITNPLHNFPEFVAVLLSMGFILSLELHQALEQLPPPSPVDVRKSGVPDFLLHK